eukprot:CAMPEP_0198732734 /NCGR_PEP_ID=MMETSP1475-20131203/38784_1 /TAXON_ID= ORGANISM="Unidentified sp., Strain CCMP1999" /NCGR_SAMPLE_ID=MMETSP1475 /ASSEMBLY_ACC=CAM_ASM_001111 /LENGTH=44 /DNA_ID= /DNA_START= /DNA_END= /DNA_ORIENTATION=
MTASKPSPGDQKAEADDISSNELLREWCCEQPTVHGEKAAEKKK